MQIQKWSKGKNGRKEIKLDESKLSSPTTLGKLAAFGQKEMTFEIEGRHTYNPFAKKYAYDPFALLLCYSS